MDNNVHNVNNLAKWFDDNESNNFFKYYRKVSYDESKWNTW